MSLLRKLLVAPGARWAQLIAATLAALVVCAFGLAAVTTQAREGEAALQAGALPPSTWVALRPLPQLGHSAIFAIGVDPFNNQVVITGTAAGSLMRSADGGSSWRLAHSGSAGLLTIAFSPYRAGVVLAGTRGSGALASKDAGLTWAAVNGLEGRTVHVFAFALSLLAAGTDHGVYVSADGLTWKQSGLPTTSIGALAVAAIHNPVRLVAGGNAASATGGAPLYQSTDGGVTWARIRAAINGNVVSCLASGPLPPASTVRPLIVGTNAGLFTSFDNGASFNPNSGGGLLPSTDYTQIAFVNHYDRYYAASDGGGSPTGGVWRTRDAGRHFTSLAPPIPSVTALAVSNDDAPILYVAAFQPADQVASLWAYHDTGGTPQGPLATVTPSASSSRTTTPTASGASGLSRLLLSPQMPYVVIGLIALIVILLAVVSHFRGRRD